MGRGTRSSQGAGGKKPLALHVLLFLPCQLPWQSWARGALHRLTTVKRVSRDLVPKLLTTASLPFPGKGEGGFARVALLAHQWARGEGDKGRPLAVDQLETEDDVCPEPGALR